MKVRWTATASRMLHTIFRYIHADDPVAAEEVAAHVRDVTRHLATFPRMGYVGREDGTRELIVPDAPYLIVYRVTDSEVQILRVFHAKQDRP